MNPLQKKLVKRKKAKVIKQSHLRELSESVKKLFDYNEEFKKIFDVNINEFAGRLCAFGIPDFDIIAFGAYMEELGWRIY